MNKPSARNRIHLVKCVKEKVGKLWEVLQRRISFGIVLTRGVRANLEIKGKIIYKTRSSGISIGK